MGGLLLMRPGKKRVREIKTEAVTGKFPAAASCVKRFIFFYQDGFASVH